MVRFAPGVGGRGGLGGGVGRSPAALAAAGRRPAKLGGLRGCTRPSELLRDLARAVDGCAAGEGAGTAACPGGVPGGPWRTGGAWAGRLCVRGATASFIGDSRTCNYPGDRRGTLVRARPDDSGRTGGPRSGARPASEGPPCGARCRGPP
jgi:hypothetical protein